MNPYAAIYEKSHKEQPSVDFPALIGWHLEHGFIHSTPDYFVMGRPVNMHAGHDLIRDPRHLFEASERNCWYVHAMSGDLTKVWQTLPYHLRYMAFDRWHAGEQCLTIVATEHLRRLCVSSLKDHDPAESRLSPIPA